MSRMTSLDPPPATAAAPAVSPKVAALGTEGAFAVLARARELERAGRSVIHLEIGEPDFATAPHVRQAAVDSLAAGETGYCPAEGLWDLREVAARHLSATRGVPFDPASVLIATGAKPFLLFTVLATCVAGDRVVLPDPCFPIYESAIRWAGAEPVRVGLREDAGFALDLDELAAALSRPARLVILNSPHNPTGGVLRRDDLAAIARLVEDSGAWVLADEVYGRILFDEAFESIVAQPGMRERTVVLDSCSKTYAMTGWRCGFAAVPPPLREPLARFTVNSTSCVPAFVQRAAIAALEGPQDSVDAMVAEFRARRSLVVEGLNALPGVSCAMPAGAFYAFPNVSRLPLSEERLAEALLEQAGVALLAGTAFGRGGAGHLRLSCASSRADLEVALERIGAFVAGL